MILRDVDSNPTETSQSHKALNTKGTKYTK
jgi:hypothetical protein